MKVLVTGGSGYIGSAVVRHLLGGGQQAKVLVREGDDLRNLAGLEVEYAHGDVRDYHSLERALDGCDRVGVTAGTSTPDYVIDAVVARLKELAPA